MLCIRLCTLVMDLGFLVLMTLLCIINCHRDFRESSHQLGLNLSIIDVSIFLGKGKIEKTLRNSKFGAIFATGRC